MPFDLKGLYLKICEIAGATLISTVIIFVFFTMFIFQISDAIDYSKKNYEVTEGVVTKFTPVKEFGRSSTFESFEVNGVKFKYKDNIIRSGYRKTKAKGGVIKGNGQYVKIGYTNQGDYNAIIFIEEPPFNDDLNNNPLRDFLLKFIVLIFAIICFVVYRKYTKRKRIYVDYYRSFIKNTKVSADQIEVECVVTIVSLFREFKNVNIFAKFKLHNKKYIAQAIDPEKLNDVFVVHSGDNKLNLIFYIKGNCELTVDNIGCWMPKIIIKSIKRSRI